MQTKPLININALNFDYRKHGDKFEASAAPIGACIGAQKLGYRLIVVSPGKQAWPYHTHLVNEEMFFILEGEGSLRYADTVYAVRAGDVISCPPGKDKPHAIMNTSNADLKYLAVSTMEEPEVVLYPDSHKYGVIAGRAPGRDEQEADFLIYGRQDAGVDYWEDED